MPHSRPQLAKLTRPRLARAVARERLFKLLDEVRETHPAICVIGPPGAGKTTLVASWLDARRIKGIWYQIDPGDTDLATFFHYLGRAAQPFTRKGQRPLPLLTPEHLGDVAGFSRRYFRELFSRLPEGSTLVLDNCQEVPAEQPFHELLAEAVDEVPPGITLLVASRRDPPECYARLIANERVAAIDWGALKLSIEEAQAIGAGRARAGHAAIARLHELSEGWAAGFILLLERLRQGGDPAGIGPGDSVRAVFDYFAAQLFERTSPHTQRLLLHLSFLPRMSLRGALELTGSPDAAEDLYRRHLFTDRRQAGETSYEFHALLRAFLQHRASQVLSLPEQRELTDRAACILEQSEQSEEALPLYLRAGDIDAAHALILRQAAKFIGQGRWNVVVGWIEALPPQRVQANCWLTHWLGTARIVVAPPEARAVLEQSADLALRSQEQLCRLQAAAGIVQTYMLEYVQFRPMDRWIDVLEDELEQHVEFPDSGSELRVHAALLIALAYRRPSSAMLPGCAERVLLLAKRDGEPNLRALSVAYVVAYGSTTGSLDLARRAHPVLARLLSHPEVTALTATWGWFITSFYYQLVGDEKECLSTVLRVERIGVEQGLAAAVRLACIIGSWVDLGAGRMVSSWRWLRRLEEVMVPGNLYDEASAASLKGHLHLIDGDPERAEAFVARALELYDQAGTHFHRCYSRTQQAWIATMRRDAEAARRWISQGLELAQQTRTGWLEVELRLAEAYLGLQEGQRAAAEWSLRLAFGIGRRADCIWAFKFSRAWMPMLCATALETGIELDYVRSIVQGMRLQPPSPDFELWPWPVKIYTLGRFEVLLDDEPLRFSHKAPRKPLALLKALIAFGGAGVAEEKLIDAVWPEEEGDAGRKAYNIALHRLRELLGNCDAITVASGALSLNGSVCWVDVWQQSACLGTRWLSRATWTSPSFYNGPMKSDGYTAGLSSPPMPTRRGPHPDGSGCAAGSCRSWRPQGASWRQRIAWMRRAIGTCAGSKPTIWPRSSIKVSCAATKPLGVVLKP